MADAKYDAVFIGAGNKALVLAMYLAKYGGMKVGMFERRHEIGGCWSVVETPLPGFVKDQHSSTHFGRYYHGPVWEDFPDWEEKGAHYVLPEITKGIIFKEDHSSVVAYSELADPNQERTAKGIARFSERDAETWLHWWKLWKEKLELANLQDMFNPPPPQGVPGPLSRAMDDPSIAVPPAWRIYSVEQLVHALFESIEMKNYMLKVMRGHTGVPPDHPLGGMAFMLCLFLFTGYGFIRGSAHNLTHAAIEIINEYGGEYFTHSEVDKIIIDNSKAKGIRLVDGTEIEATKAVISCVDPHMLCLRLIGEEHISPEILTGLRGISKRHGSTCWDGWAVHEPAKWKAADFNPDISGAASLTLTTKDLDQLAREYAWRRLGKIPPPEDTPILIVWQTMPECGDQKRRAPEGKHYYVSEYFIVPATAMSEKEWLKFKRERPFFEQKLWAEYAPNMTWDNIIASDVDSPYDCKRLLNTGPEGNVYIIDNVPSQKGAFRPIPELASHRTPIKNLYATGAAWHPLGTAGSWQGYNCYKIMAEDYGLRKPWEEKGRPY